MGQILDDSTKNIYGPKTCRYTYFNNIKYNQPKYYHPDTTLTRFHIYNYVNRKDNKIQDLGNIGTSATPVYFEQPETIGRTSGYYTYNEYFQPIDKIKLYNTKSPYTDVYAIFGGGNRYILDVSHSQNIKPNWDFGGSFEKLTINKQISSTGRGDLETSSTSYNFYTCYWTKDSSYFVMGAFSRMFHKVNESGGINNKDFKSINNYFKSEVNVNLENANSSLKRIDYLLYQQFRLAPQLILYNDFKRTVSENVFTESKLSSEGKYFPRILINNSSTSESATFKEYFNETGIKGDFHKAFYNLFARIRGTEFEQKYIIPIEHRTETYIGGNLRYDNDSTYFLLLKGELMQNGNHRFGAEYENRLWKLSYQRMMIEPGAMQEHYFGNHYEWINNFKAIQSDKALAMLKIRVGNFNFLPKFSFDLVKNNIYFGLDKFPRQATGFAQILSPGFNFDLTFVHYLHLNGEFIYSLITGDKEAQDAFRIPTMFANSQLYFQKQLFNNNLLFMTGLDIHYQSGFYAKAYDVVTQQFYLQNDFLVPQKVLADIYINFKIDNVRVFTKFTYINQPKGSGYFATPYYTGQKKVFELGISWMFYD
jgi:hypothetical protein